MTRPFWVLLLSSMFAGGRFGVAIIRPNSGLIETLQLSRARSEFDDEEEE